MARDGESYLDVYKRACPDRYARSTACSKHQSDVARKLASKPEVKKYVEEIKAKTAKRIEEISEEALEDEIITRRQFWAYQTKIIKHFIEKDPEEYTRQMFLLASKLVFEQLKIEQLEEWRRMAEEKAEERRKAEEESRRKQEEEQRPHNYFIDNLPKDDNSDDSE